MQHACGMPADIARAHDEFLAAHRRLDLALHHIGNRLVRVTVQRRADAGGIANLEERHLIALDERLDEEIAAVGGLALDGADCHGLNVAVSRLDHLTLPLPSLTQRATARSRPIPSRPP